MRPGQATAGTWKAKMRVKTEGREKATAYTAN